MEVLEKNRITPDSLGMLMFVKLNSSPSQYITDVIETYMYNPDLLESGIMYADMLEKEGLIKYIKTGRKDPWYRVRLSEKGEQLLKDLGKKPEHPLAQFMLDTIIHEYTLVEAQDKVKKGPKLLYYISEFLYLKESYTEKMIQAVVKAYCESFDYEQRKFMNNMGTLLFKPTNVYATKWTAEDSPLCTFIDKSQEKIKQTYRIL